ncbi:MAG: hypothetical protein LBC87_02335 [Fibromonadaceae bacterium]|jgi:hypothetical protein|nr:hypothetical protein [Fibromonadaceae bacterium]
MTVAAMLMKEIETLPEESAKEALDFVLFLRNKANLNIYTHFKQAEETKFPGMDKPVHLGFDLKKISREELYER